MDALFTSQVLTEAINQVYPVKTTILDKVFGAKKFLPTGVFSWDIITGSRRILKNLKVGDSATVRDKQGRKTVTCNGARFSEKRFISAADLDKLRGFGEQYLPQLVGDMIRTELEDIKSDVDRTREYMAAKAITGTIVDDAGVTIVDFGFSGAQAPVLIGKQKWDDSESNPIKNIRAWKKLITKAVGSVDKFVAFCGATAMDALIENEAILKLLGFSNGKQIADEGRIINLAGVDIEEITGTYLDSSNVAQNLIADAEFILVGVSSQTAAEIFAPVVDLKDANGVGSGNPASMFFSKSWETEDPSGKWIKGEARPLPILYKPDAIIKATVV